MMVIINTIDRKLVTRYDVTTKLLINHKTIPYQIYAYTCSFLLNRPRRYLKFRVKPLIAELLIRGRAKDTLPVAGFECDILLVYL